MGDILDLEITLTPPPADSPADVLARIGLHCPDLGLSHQDTDLYDPLAPAERQELHWYLEQYWKWPFAEFAKRGANVEGLLEDVGQRLYQAVFGSRDARVVLQAWRDNTSTGLRQISIISYVPAALTLPWELLHDTQGFLVLRSVSIVRRLPQIETPAGATAFSPPLRVLLVTARPDDTGFIDQRAIARELLDEVQEQIAEGKLALEFLRPPTLQALQQRLRDKTRPVHILHFDGHGTFDSTDVGQQNHVLSGKPRGKLAFEDAAGRLALVDADTLANVLQASNTPLAVLTACQSARSTPDDAFSSVAGRLIKGGVDAVVAMSASVLVVTAARYVEAFYRELARGVSAPTAHELARQALYVDPKRHVFQRERDKEAQPVTLQDWWLPHFYQQRPVRLQPVEQERTPKSASLAAFSGFPDGFPYKRQRMFFGRARELLQIERRLRHGKVVVLHGFGGVGKTALAHEAADWFTRTGMYSGALFLSFEHGADATLLLQALGTHLGIIDAEYTPNDPQAALARLHPALKQRPTLIIADNLESILPGGEAPLDPPARTQLWDVLLELAKSNAGVVLTTRTTAFGDGRYHPGRPESAYLPLAGLHPNDAYALASTLVEDLQIDRSQVAYPDLRDLLEQLDHHPLAIHLVLPALRDYPIQQIRDDFANLLPKFVDDTEHGRNRSLLASLEYSLQRLRPHQRPLLARLAPFEGGASESNLLAITKIPELDWSELRQGLEQSALITAERIHNSIRTPFLRFHPALTPFLRAQIGADDAALHEQYVAHYYGLTNYLYTKDDRSPQPVRALARCELPNLRRTLTLLMAMGEHEAAVDMAESIARFLTIFGALRVRDHLWKQLETAPIGEGTLTLTMWTHQSNIGEAELSSGNPNAAHGRFTTLLRSIEILPEGTPLGRGSYVHCLTLHRLARCLTAGGQQTAAKQRLCEALSMIDVLIAERPSDQDCLRERGALLVDLGDVLANQGIDGEARTMYEQALQVKRAIQSERGAGVVLGQLGTLALRGRNYAEAYERLTSALNLFRTLGEAASEAVIWYQLGVLAQEQQQWSEAEHCYRESVAIEERYGDLAGAAATYNSLAIVAIGAGRPAEAEGWYRRAIELSTQVGNQVELARNLNNLADLLVSEVKTDRARQSKLLEARSYAQRALEIREKLEVSAGIWTTFNTLAAIADLEGAADDARTLRQREREAFATFERNRYEIDRQLGLLIAAIAAGAQGDETVQAAAAGALPELEERGWRIADATRRIWAGERDWHTLCEKLDGQQSLVVLRILEAIAETAGGQNRWRECIAEVLPPAVRTAMEQGDQVAFDQAMKTLPREEQQRITAVLEYLQALQTGG